ncbi:zinc finger protein 385C-like isoform X2 [Pygocentrus nattereri]|uniref:zinc finger protein 385C-like isoform X2 n=1 Tax=Pygocentrus nattereri TaxID=42514 RepID=UPI000814976C|nr:zinc finger protein 385C-like isoform X2 [Pygocentrus nattereri]
MSFPGQKTDSPHRARAGMKRPSSPGFPEIGPAAASELCMGHRHRDGDPRPKRERKQRTLTLCEVCNIQLNSSAQAQIHYNGKTHQRRLRQANQAKNNRTANNNTGSPVQGSPLLTSLPLPGRPLQPQLDLKHILPLRVNGSSPLSLFPNFNTMDPVQKAVISHTFGLPQPIKKKQIISCNICHLRFNSTNQAEAHYKGHKHARKLKAIDNQKNKQRNQGREREREKKKERAREEGKAGHLPALMDSSVLERPAIMCDSQVAHLKLDEAHAQGNSVMLTPISDSSSTDPAPLQSPQVSPNSQQSVSSCEAVPDPPALGSDSEPSDQPKGDQEHETGAEPNREGRKNKQNLHCPVCKVTVNSRSQMDAHYSGSKHKLMLEGQCVQPRRRGGKVVSSRMNPRSKRHGNKNSATSSSQSYHCDVCDITVNSETQLKQHMSSRRHKDRLAGKPPKPKFSPYNKSSASSVLANAGLAGLLGGAGSAFGGVYHPYSLTTITPQVSPEVTSCPNPKGSSVMRADQISPSEGAVQNLDRWLSTFTSDPRDPLHHGNKSSYLTPHHRADHHYSNPPA